MKSIAILIFMTLLTILGDYFVKVASGTRGGLITPRFLLGAILYGSTAIGWFFLMKSHSLAAIGVMYSAATILLLTGLGYFVFKEQLGLREMAGVALALASVALMSNSS